MHELQLLQLSKSYGDYRVFHIPDIRLHQGQYWIKGINGSGKTTLMQVIAGQLPFSGDCVLDGCSLRADPVTYRSKVSYAPAEPDYPPFLTGSELLRFYRSVRQSDPTEIKEMEALFEVDFLSRKIGAYSSGMKKKLSLMAALLGGPSLYLLDEPLITLDQTAVQNLWKLVEIKRRAGASFLFSSHQELELLESPLKATYEISHQSLVTC